MKIVAGGFLGWAVVGGLLLSSAACSPQENDDSNEPGPGDGDGDAPGSGGTDPGSGGEGGAPEMGGAGPDGSGGIPEIEMPETPLDVSSETLPVGRIGDDYSFDLDVMSEGESDAWLTLGVLPAGLELEVAGGQASIVGTPETPGTYEFGVLFQGSEGTELIRSYTLRVLTLPWLLYGSEGRCYAIDLSDGSPSAPIPYCDSIPLGEDESARAITSTSTGSVGLIAGSDQNVWVASLGGMQPSKPAQVSAPLASPAGFIQNIHFSNDGKWAHYIKRENYEDPEVLVLVSLAGPSPGLPQTISDPVPEGGSINSSLFAGDSIIYSAFNPALSAGRIFEIELGASAGPAIPLNGWESEYHSTSPDGNRIAFWKRRSESAGDWYVVGRGGYPPASPMLLHEPLTGTDRTSSYVSWSSDSSKAYLAIDRADGDDDLLQVAFDEAGPKEAIRLEGDEPAGIRSFSLSPDNTQIMYDVETEIQLRTELWVVDISGPEPGAPRRIDGPHPSGGSVGESIANLPTLWSPDGRYIVYAADSETADLFEVYVTSATSPEPSAVRLHDNLTAEHKLYGNISFSPQGNVVVMTGDFETWAIRRPIATLLTGDTPGPRIPLEFDVAETESVNSADWSPDGAWLALSIYDMESELGRLVLVPFNGSSFGAALELTDSALDTSLSMFLPAGF